MWARFFSLFFFKGNFWGHANKAKGAWHAHNKVRLLPHSLSPRVSSREEQGDGECTAVAQSRSVEQMTDGVSMPSRRSLLVISAIWRYVTFVALLVRKVVVVVGKNKATRMFYYPPYHTAYWTVDRRAPKRNSAATSNHCSQHHGPQLVANCVAHPRQQHCCANVSKQTPQQHRRVVCDHKLPSFAFYYASPLSLRRSVSSDNVSEVSSAAATAAAPGTHFSSSRRNSVVRNPPLKCLHHSVRWDCIFFQLSLFAQLYLFFWKGGGVAEACFCIFETAYTFHCSRSSSHYAPNSTDKVFLRKWEYSHAQIILMLLVGLVKENLRVKFEFMKKLTWNRIWKHSVKKAIRIFFCSLHLLRCYSTRQA